MTRPKKVFGETLRSWLLSSRIFLIFRAWIETDCVGLNSFAASASADFELSMKQKMKSNLAFQGH